MQYPDGNFANPVIALSKLNLLTSSVLNKCGAQNGINDGFVDNPLACNFNPAVDLPKCPNNIDGPACFTSQQVATLNSIYNGMISADFQIFPGYMPGAENSLVGTNWTLYIFGTPSAIAGNPTPAHPSGVPTSDLFFAEDFIDSFVTFTHLTQPVSYLDFDLFDHTDVSNLLSVAPILNADSPFLSAFHKNNGKLILYQGWNDPVVPPLETILYYAEVTLLNGNNSARLIATQVLIKRNILQ